jgi:hypothetical protein
MYIVDSFTGAKAKEVATAPPPFGAGFSNEQISSIESLEIIGTSFNDPGPDYCEFIVKDKKGKVIALKQIPKH